MVSFSLFPQRDFMYRLTQIHWSCPLMVRVGSALHLVFGNIQQAFSILHVRNILVIDFIFQFELRTWNQISHLDISKDYLFVQMKGTLCEIALNHNLCHQQRSGLPGDTEEILITWTNSFSGCSFSGLTTQGGMTDFLQLISHPFTTGKETATILKSKRNFWGNAASYFVMNSATRCLFPFCLYSLNLPAFILPLHSF